MWSGPVPWPDAVHVPSVGGLMPILARLPGGGGPPHVAVGPVGGELPAFLESQGVVEASALGTVPVVSGPFGLVDP